MPTATSSHKPTHWSANQRGGARLCCAPTINAFQLLGESSSSCACQRSIIRGTPYAPHPCMLHPLNYTSGSTNQHSTPYSDHHPPPPSYTSRSSPTCTMQLQFQVTDRARNPQTIRSSHTRGPSASQPHTNSHNSTSSVRWNTRTFMTEAYRARRSLLGSATQCVRKLDTLLHVHPDLNSSVTPKFQKAVFAGFRVGSESNNSSVLCDPKASPPPRPPRLQKHNRLPEILTIADPPLHRQGESFL